MLGQLKTKEITAIPELIKTLLLEGAIVTIDAMGCQKKITETIIDAGADYVIQVKENQKKLYGDIAFFFQDPTNGPFDIFKALDGEYGRIETRHYLTTSDLGWLQGKEDWAGINTISIVVRERDINGVTSSESSFFISNLENHASSLAKPVKEHWGIENGLHWCFDIAFREDHCRVRKGHAPENFSILRHMATNLLKREKALKSGLQTNRLKAAWDPDYLMKLLAN